MGDYVQPLREALQQQSCALQTSLLNEILTNRRQLGVWVRGIGESVVSKMAVVVGAMSTSAEGLLASDITFINWRGLRGGGGGEGGVGSRARIRGREREKVRHRRGPP